MWWRRSSVHHDQLGSSPGVLRAVCGEDRDAFRRLTVSVWTGTSDGASARVPMWHRRGSRPAAVASIWPGDAALVAGLLARDEALFERLVRAWTPALVRVAADT